MAERMTLDEFLEKNEQSLRVRLIEWNLKLTERQLPASITVRHRPSYQGSTTLLGEVPITQKLVSIQEVIDAVRKLIVTALNGIVPVDGVLDVRVSSRGEKDSPDISMSRRLCPPEAEDVREVAFLRSELSYYRDLTRAMQGQAMEMLRSSHTTIGTLTGNLQALATTRGATTSMADVSPMQMLLGVILLPVLLPRINKMLGLRATAPIDATMSRVQALGQTSIERLISQVEGELIPDEAPARVSVAQRVEQEEATVEQLPSTPSGAETPKSPVDRTPSTPPPTAAPTWPTAAELVEQMVTNEAFADDVMTAILASPGAKAILKARAPQLMAALL